jgi:imidazolonepropionase
MAHLPCIDNAYLFIRDGLVNEYGSMDGLDETRFKGPRIDASGRYVFPCWCDPHTHIVFAGSREHEFVDKINGLSYEEIARRGGGILNSVQRLREASEDELFEQSMQRLHEVIASGTGAVEIKSGYGLSVEDEMKMLRVIARMKDASPACIRATFLGAHAVPAEYRHRRGEYVRLITDVMIPRIAADGLADFCDVFCDRGFFTPEETDIILTAGTRYGLRAKLHANELDYSGGIQVGVRHRAISVDHLEYTGDAEVEALLHSETMPVLLPGTAFFLRLPYAPARKMIDAGLPVALGSDYNPGSCPAGKMPWVISLACIQMKMLPQEAIHAATVNASYAMGLSASHGSIAKGKTANVFITKKISSIEYMPYAFGSDHIDTVILKGHIYSSQTLHP